MTVSVDSVRRLRLPRLTVPGSERLGRYGRAWSAAGSARPGGYVLLVATVAVLNIVGMVMILSASSVQSLANYGSAWYFFERQLMWTVLGVIAFAVVSRIDYHRWQRSMVPLLLLAGFLLTIVLIPAIGLVAYGS